jgi:hypothetical protein
VFDALDRVHNLHVNGGELLVLGRDGAALVGDFVANFRHKITVDAIRKREQNRRKKITSRGTHSEMCTNTLSPPSFGSMNPWPFSLQNDRTMPLHEGPVLARSDLKPSSNAFQFDVIF